HERRRVLEADPAGRLRAGADAGAGGHVLEVEARAEPAAGAGEDDDPHAAVAVELDERPAEVGDHRAADGVEPVGPVQRDRGDAPVPFEQHVRHQVLLPCRALRRAEGPSRSPPPSPHTGPGAPPPATAPELGLGRRWRRGWGQRRWPWWWPR